MVALLLPARRADTSFSADDARLGKRPRRSIFISCESDDSDSDYEELHDRLHVPDTESPTRLRPDSVCATGMVPATPMNVHALASGSCQLTPSFPRRASSPGMPSTDSMFSNSSALHEVVAVCEEPNAGFRSYMEDRCATMQQDGVAYFGVYDGHGGTDASIFLQQHLLPAIRARLRPGCDVHDALLAAYLDTNNNFRATGSIQGSTATTIVLKDSRLIAANVGDSPAFVIKRNGEVFSLIKEHKIEGEEAARLASHSPPPPIYKTANGPAYMGTPDGTRWLNMSRAFGDFCYPAISCEPHVCTLDVSDGRYLVMGSDGLTEKWSTAEAAQYVSQLAAHGTSLPDIARCLVERSKARGSTDNISCMVVDLGAWLEQQETAAAAAAVAPVAEGHVVTTGASPTPASRHLWAQQQQQQQRRRRELKAGPVAGFARQETSPHASGSAEQEGVGAPQQEGEGADADVDAVVFGETGRREDQQWSETVAAVLDLLVPACQPAGALRAIGVEAA